jgi:hypothetical protein
MKLREDIHLSNSLMQKELFGTGGIVSPSGQTPTIRDDFGVPNIEEMRSEEPANDGILSYAFTQYSLKQALSLFPEDTKEATMKEMRQFESDHSHSSFPHT